MKGGGAARLSDPMLTNGGRETRKILRAAEIEPEKIVGWGAAISGL